MPTQTCDSIQVTYTLVGEEPVTVEVEKETNPINGKNFFFVFISGLPYSLFWNETFWKISQGPGVDQATLSEDTPCPFGTYTILEGSIFESFEVTSCETETEEDRIINCYRLAVWKEQCEYAQCVLKYLIQLQFGINNCEALEKLKNKRRVLNILNCYDPRDILNDTTEYNSITYTEIKQLLNYL